VFHLDDLLGSDGAGDLVTGTSPGPDDPGTVEGSAYRYYVYFSTDRPTSWVSARIRDGALYASSVFGLTYVLDLTTGSVDVSSGDAYRRDYARRRLDDPTLPDLDRHLAGLLDSIRVWKRKPSQ
jgi:hypothetical protein